MSRSGYSDDCDGWALIRWRGAVSQAIRGKRGQAMLGEMLQALDALPDPSLGAESLVTATGEYCALGALGRARAMDLESIDPDDRKSVAQAFDVAEALAAEIMDINDRGSFDERIYFNFDVCGPMRGWESHRQLRWTTDPKAGRIRWSRMRAWAASHIKEKP
jgi:predicted outer membrane lipoprotein